MHTELTTTLLLNSLETQLCTSVVGYQLKPHSLNQPANHCTVTAHLVSRLLYHILYIANR